MLASFFASGIDNTTIETVMNVFQAGLEASLTPPISYGIVLGIALMAVSVVGAWFRYRHKRA